MKIQLGQTDQNRTWLKQFEHASSIGKVVQYDMFPADLSWSWGELTEIANTMLIAWYNEWYQMIWVDLSQFQSYHDELDAFHAGMMELYPDGWKWSEMGHIHIDPVLMWLITQN